MSENLFKVKWIIFIQDTTDDKMFCGLGWFKYICMLSGQYISGRGLLMIAVWTTNYDIFCPCQTTQRRLGYFDMSSDQHRLCHFLPLSNIRCLVIQYISTGQNISWECFPCITKCSNVFIILGYLFFIKGSSWPWSYGSWIYNYMCYHCLSPLKLWVRTPFMGRCTRYNIIW